MDTPLSLFAPWFVAHTRPRCEKKLVSYAARQDCPATLTCYHSVKQSRGKTVVFEKPLFPGYVFLRLLPEQRQKIYQSDYLANLLPVPDQAQFAQQLADVERSLANLEILLSPRIVTGSRVRIVSGSLQGMEGLVEARTGLVHVTLRVDFLSRAAAVKVEATHLELF